MTTTERFGRLTIEFPQGNYPVEVVAQGQRLPFYDVLRAAALPDGTPLTDDELEWLAGFDGDVAAHNNQIEWITQQHDPRR